MELLRRIFSVRTIRNHKLTETETKKSEHILGEASEQRSVMTVTFANPELADARFSGPCLHIKGDVLHIDAPFQETHFTCFGEEVDVTFSLERDGHIVYLRFNSFIREYQQDSGFVLDIPRELHSNQRREFVRISPPKTNILHFEVWLLQSDSFPPPASCAFEYDSYRKDKEEISLVNISAAGLGLKIKKDQKNPDAYFAEGSSLLCFLQLKNIQNRQKRTRGRHADPAAETLALWLACTIKHCVEQEGFADVLLGVNFTAWAVPDSKEKPLVWSSAGEMGQVPLLSDWVWGQQLALISRHCQ